jgi:ferredoxin
MIKAVCVHHRASPFCVLACPSGALVAKEGEAWWIMICATDAGCVDSHV